MAEFTKLREALSAATSGDGETEYQSILSRHGVQRPSEFQSRQPARLCAKELYLAIQNHRLDEIVNGTTVEPAAAVVAVACEANSNGGQRDGD